MGQQEPGLWSTDTPEILPCPVLGLRFGEGAADTV